MFTEGTRMTVKAILEALLDGVLLRGITVEGFHGFRIVGTLQRLGTEDAPQAGLSESLFTLKIYSESDGSQVAFYRDTWTVDGDWVTRVRRWSDSFARDNGFLDKGPMDAWMEAYGLTGALMLVLQLDCITMDLVQPHGREITREKAQAFEGLIDKFPVFTWTDQGLTGGDWGSGNGLDFLK